MTAPSPRETLGLIAGSGRFPHLVADGARAAGRRVVVIALRGCADESLRETGDVFYRAGIVQAGRWIRILRREGAREAIMAGAVEKAQMLRLPRWRQWLAYLPDWTSIRIWYFRAADRRNDTLLRAVADAMAEKGVRLIDSTQYCRDALAPVGVLTRRRPTPAQGDDVALGWRIAREMGRLDVGQSVAVKDKDIIAVEAIEGTARLIARCGELCPAGGWTLVKTAKPNQDPRFDVPTVGPATIEQMAAAGGAVLVIEGDKTLMLDRDRMIEAADRAGIVIVGRTD
ncbi:MAG: UDP-2,3-diacylglucosamine diphosphatase LpxI [Phycisphaerae bacterium]|nr:UDP-2,3-diacylglucosamine diphosphatase LpxI [Phycisphaerae bacterium]